MEGWVDPVDLIAPWPGVKPATFRSRLQRRTAAPPRQPAAYMSQESRPAVHNNVRYMVTILWAPQNSQKFSPTFIYQTLCSTPSLLTVPTSRIYYIISKPPIMLITCRHCPEHIVNNKHKFSQTFPALLVNFLSNFPTFSGFRRSPCAERNRNTVCISVSLATQCNAMHSHNGHTPNNCKMS